MSTVLFLCVHNAARSQMALGWFRHLAGDRHAAQARGAEPANRVNTAATQAMAEVGIDIGREVPAVWTPDDLEDVDVVVTMGCGDAVPTVTGARWVDWPVPDPAGQTLERVRPIRDEIERLARGLLVELAPAVDVDERRTEWQAVLAHERKRTVTDGGIQVAFADGVPVGELAALADAERRGYPFLSFVLRIEASGVVLEASAPSEGRELLDAVLASGVPGS